MSTVFETQVCNRCGGTGHYSFNMVHGTMCYGCQGSGEKFTKRGQSAFDYYKGLRTIKAADVEVGQRIKAVGAKFTVTEIKADDDNPGRIKFTSSSNNVYSLSDQYEVLIIPTAENNEELKKQALEYQSKLTKAGKMMKKHIKEGEK